MTIGNASILEGGLILLAGIAVVACVWTVRRQNLRWPRARKECQPENADGSGEKERELHGDLVSLCERVDSSLDRLEGQCDTRIARLEQLLTAADSRIAGLERLRREADQGLHAASPRAAGDSTKAKEPLADARRPHEPADSSRAGLPAATEVGASPAHQSEAERIYALAAQGLPPIKIAEAVAVPLGEVELMLNLRRFAANCDRSR